MPDELYPMPAAGILSNPTTVPSLGSSAGALNGAAYIVAYAYVNANGKTKVGPAALIALDDDEQVDVTAITPLPAGVSSVDWFISEEENSSVLRFIANNVGGAFSINALPDEDAALVPTRNTTGGTGVRPNSYTKHPKRLEDGTVTIEFEDLGADFVRHAGDVPQRWTLEYRGKSEIDIKVLDDFWHSHWLDTGFTLQEPRDFPSVTGEPGETITGVHFEQYEDGGHTKKWRNDRIVHLIKRPV
ncbi:MAG TPA: hypothetical protein VHO25_17805 [Polyangiaceae bacterium]|nr:hypothetical protein [Polyangiaceae bacterium]